MFKIGNLLQGVMIELQLFIQVWIAKHFYLLLETKLSIPIYTPIFLRNKFTLILVSSNSST